MNNKRNTATETYITYAPETDMTFIMKQVVDADTMEAISDECIGWSYGKITISEALNMQHNLKAVYVDEPKSDEPIRETTADIISQAIEPNAIEVAKLLAYLEAQPFITNTLDTSSQVGEAVFDALAEEFYSMKVRLEVGSMSTKLDMDAAVFSALTEAFKYIIDQQ